MKKIPEMFNEIWAGPKAPFYVPPEFHRIHDLAYNLWWSWNPLAGELWGRIDPLRWAANRNPLSMLPVVERQTWEALVANVSFNQLYEEVTELFDEYLAGLRMELAELPSASMHRQAMDRWE